MTRIQRTDTGAVATLTVTSPPYNLLDAALVTELRGAIRAANRSREIRVVVLASGVDGTYLGGYDVREIVAGARRAGLPMPPAAAPVVLAILGQVSRLPGGRALLDRTPLAGAASFLGYHALLRAMRRSDKVFIAAIDGPALCGGFDVALSCDLRYAVDGDYQVGLYETTFGLVDGASQQYVRSVGAARSIEYLLEGRTFCPREAAAAGLVHHVVPDSAALLPAVHACAQRLARRTPGAVRATKRAVYENGSRPLERGLARTRSLFMPLVTTTRAQQLLELYGLQQDDYRHRGLPLDDFVTKALPDWQEGTAEPSPR